MVQAHQHGNLLQGAQLGVETLEFPDGELAPGTPGHVRVEQHQSPGAEPGAAAELEACAIQ